MEDNFLKMLSILSPGKLLRDGIERILDAGLGALIFLASDPDKYIREGIIQLGFKIDADFSPEKIYELCKMDGAIVLNKTGDRILYANVDLNPDKNIFSIETGMRHRTADKISSQTGDTSIAVSKRRKSVSLYFHKNKYELLPESVLFARLNQEITIAHRYKQSFLDLLSYLSLEETRKTVNLYDVSEVISKGMITIRITEGMERYLNELGKVAGSVKLEYEEILKSIPKIVGAVIMDYSTEDLNIQKSEEAIKIYDDVKTEEFVNFFKISRTLGYELSSDDTLEEIIVVPRGYKILYSTKLPAPSIKNVVQKFDNLNNLYKATYDDLTNVSGIGKKRAEMIMGALSRRKKEIDVEE